MTMNELRTFDPFAMEPFGESVSRLMRPWKFEAPDTAPTIKIDVSETDASYTVKAEIPGVHKDDIDIRIDGNLVTIAAEVKKEKEEKKEGRVLRSERQYGYASRSFTLASAVDDAKAEAKYDNGVLSLMLPKKTAASSRRLSVK
jgi:HSP20 family protein